jgi:hypothetical protein
VKKDRPQHVPRIQPVPGPPLPVAKEYPSWLPSPAQIEVAVARQRAERERLARRIDDGPLTILAPEGYGPTPGFSEPVPAWRRIWNRICNKLRK